MRRVSRRLCKGSSAAIFASSTYEDDRLGEMLIKAEKITLEQYEESVRLAIRTQQILAYETGVALVADPLGGSYFIESLTEEGKIPPREIGKSNINVLQEIKEGFLYAFGFAPIKLILLLLALTSLVGIPYRVMMPVFARDILQGGPHTLGF
jgi:hypothetical protein